MRKNAGWIGAGLPLIEALGFIFIVKEIIRVEFSTSVDKMCIKLGISVRIVDYPRGCCSLLGGQ